MISQCIVISDLLRPVDGVLCALLLPGVQHHQKGETPAEVWSGTDCFRELHQPSCPGGAGLLHEQQVL